MLSIIFVYPETWNSISYLFLEERKYDTNKKYLCINSRNRKKALWIVLTLSRVFVSYSWLLRYHFKLGCRAAPDFNYKGMWQETFRNFNFLARHRFGIVSQKFSPEPIVQNSSEILLTHESRLSFFAKELLLTGGQPIDQRTCRCTAGRSLRAHLEFCAL